MKQRLLIIAITFIVILGISIGGFVIVQRSPKLQNTVAKLANVTTTTNTTISKNTNTTVVDVHHLADLQAVARIFAERYGSSTNQDPTASLRAVLPYTSDRLAGILQANIADIATHSIPSISIVIQTKAYVLNPTNVQSTVATVIVSTIRQESVGSAPTKQTKQDITLQFVRQRNIWTVDQAQWGDATAYGN